MEVGLNNNSFSNIVLYLLKTLFFLYLLFQIKSSNELYCS